MPNQLQVLSVYEGFFSGGARILHSDVLTGLHGRRGQRHAVLSIHGEMYREATRQPMELDLSYRKLVAADLPVSTLGHAAADRPFDEADLAAAARLVARSDVVLTLKEQPLRLLNRVDLRGRPVISCLHRSDPENQGPAFRELAEAAASGRLAAAVCCAHSAKDAYARAGIPADLLHVIPNGVDLRRFRRSRPARAALRAEQGIPAGAPVVVLAARYDPMKNVALFLAAARTFLDRRPDGHILICGPGMTSGNPALMADLAAAGLDLARDGVRRVGSRRLDSRIHLLGPRSDPEAVFNAADVVALTSAFGEAAPLCLIEGMMCGAVPVATDIGDCAAIVAGHGLITPPDAEAIAGAWAEALARRPEFQHAAARSRHRFGRARMISAYGGLIRQTYRTAPRTVWFPAVALIPAVPAVSSIPLGTAIPVGATVNALIRPPAKELAAL
jgi:glycosyltransferase involved in cell wall biosynthesis